jgi:hypothetical protein
MSTEQVLAIALGLVAFFGGMWVRTIQADLKEMREKQRDYVLREDLHRELSSLSAQLTRIDAKIDTFMERLDKKADK